MRILREKTAAVVIDVQSKLFPFISENEKIEKNILRLINGLKVLDIPILVTEQYTKGLGSTIDSIKSIFTDDFNPIEKMQFSCMDNVDFQANFLGLSKDTLIIFGIESHVCVLQTALDLIEAGYSVFLVNDCVASRSNSDKKYAQRRIAESGAIGTTYESVLFELLGGARQEGFKDISALVK